MLHFINTDLVEFAHDDGKPALSLYSVQIPLNDAFPSADCDESRFNDTPKHYRLTDSLDETPVNSRSKYGMVRIQSLFEHLTATTGWGECQEKSVHMC
jgi:hypothetical protein